MDKNKLDVSVIKKLIGGDPIYVRKAFQNTKIRYTPAEFTAILDKNLSEEVKSVRVASWKEDDDKVERQAFS